MKITYYIEDCEFPTNRIRDYKRRIKQFDSERVVPISEAIQSINELHLETKKHKHDQKMKTLIGEIRYLKSKLMITNADYYEAEVNRLLSMLKRRNRQIDEMYDEILVLKGSSPVARSDYWKKRLKYE